MKRIYFLILVLLQLSSCTQNVPLEVDELSKIIESTFKDIPTATNLIPLEINKELTFEQFLPNFNNENRTDNASSPKPPNPNANNLVCKVSSLPFQQLILNQLINEIEFKSLLEEVKRIENTSFKLSTNLSTDKTVVEVIKEKSFDSFQNFAYPIMTEQHLIIYRNIYHSINSETGVEGNGTFFIYEKINDEWKLIHKATKWIT